MTKAQIEKLREVSLMIEEHGLDEIIERLKYECLKAAYIVQFLDDNQHTRRPLYRIINDFEKIMKEDALRKEKEQSGS